jgi:hypothetical protein
MIKLNIQKLVDNINYEQQLEEYKSNKDYYWNNKGEYPNKQIVECILDVEITDKQFEAIRKEIINNF